MAFNIHQLSSLPVTARQVQEATRRHLQLSIVMRYTQESWPSNIAACQLQQYAKQWYVYELDKGGGLFWGTRVIAPPLLQNAVLAELYASHPGIVRM